MIDAARRASAYKVIAVMPYYGYARQDRKDRPRVAIGSKLVANMLVAAGADRVFADTKFCDIPNTVAGAVRSICGLDPWLLNVHAAAGSAAMRAARNAAEEHAEQTGKPRPLIIAVTGWGADEDRRRSREAGFDAHLVKPVDYAELQKHFSADNIAL